MALEENDGGTSVEALLSTGEGVEGHDGGTSGEALLSTGQGARLIERGCCVMYI